MLVKTEKEGFYGWLGPWHLYDFAVGLKQWRRLYKSSVDDRLGYIHYGPSIVGGSEPGGTCG